MAEINVVKGAKPEAKEVTPRMEPSYPFFRGSLFGMNPFAMMRQFTDDMDRFFTDKGFPRFEGREAWKPAIDIKEEAGKLTIKADLPGVKKEDMKVNISDDILTLEGEKKEEKEEKKEGYYHSERAYGKFARSIRLPEGAKLDAVNAQFNNGVLEITVPTAEKKPARKEIPVQEAPKAKTTAG